MENNVALYLNKQEYPPFKVDWSWPFGSWEEYENFKRLQYNDNNDDDIDRQRTNFGSEKFF